jgi:hypothetical protein
MRICCLKEKGSDFGFRVISYFVLGCSPICGCVLVFSPMTSSYILLFISGGYVVFEN